MLKLLVRPGVGEILLESSAFSVDGSDHLRMVVYLPANASSARAIETLAASVTAS